MDAKDWKKDYNNLAVTWIPPGHFQPKLDKGIAKASGDAQAGPASSRVCQPDSSETARRMPVPLSPVQSLSMRSRRRPRAPPTTRR